ncbi:hypothetical protein BH09BAC5_BH09BAC5_17950 [soil metagenome]
MKKFFTLFAFSFLFVAISFAQDCINPVSSVVYQSNFNQIAVQQTNQKKLDKANEFVKNNCISAAQVKNLAQLFTDDIYRLEFCKVAYFHTFDRINFYDVYDAFSSFSNAFRLHDFIQANAVVVTTNPNPPTSNPNPVFPAYVYPSIANYNGPKGCNGPVISDDAFKLIAQNVFQQPTDESKLVAIQNASNMNCMSFAMMMKLTSLVNNEALRLNILENTFSKVFDQNNYNSGAVLFAEQNNQNNWIGFAQNFLIPPLPPCITNDADFKSVLNNVQAKHFDNEQMDVILLAAKDRCFSVAQIRTFSKEFPFGEDKMKLFKSLYAKCNDQSNYYQLVDELTFQTEKTELTNFINSGGK